MQLHMFWALYIHAADAQEVQGDPDKQEDVWDDLRNLRAALLGVAVAQGRARAAARAGARRRRSSDYCTRGAYDEFWARKENDFTRFWHEHADIPATMTTGWYDGFPHSDTEYFAAMAAKNTAPQRLIVGPWSHVGMRGDVTWTLDVDFGPDSRWGVAALLRRAAALLRRAISRTDGAARRPAGQDLRDGRRHRPQDGARQARPRRPLARRAGVAARARAQDDGVPGSRTARSRESETRRRSRGRSRTTRRIPCRRSAATTAPSASSRRRARAWSRCGCACSTRRCCCGTS